jgi:hypothetical protein
MRIKLNCLACGHSMDLGDAYEDYEGEVRCWGCQAVLDVTLSEGKLRRMRLGAARPAPRQTERGSDGGTEGQETR